MRKRLKLYCCIILLISAVFLIGCAKSQKQKIIVDVQVVGGLNGQFETIYNGKQSLEYYFDGELLGIDELGEKKLLLLLKEVEGPRLIEINAPPRIVAGTGKAVVSETNNLDPYVRDKAISDAISIELERIQKD